MKELTTKDTEENPAGGKALINRLNRAAKRIVTGEDVRFLII
jgi:hypothetical protein